MNGFRVQGCGDLSEENTVVRSVAGRRDDICGTDAGSYLRLIDACITQRKAQGPYRTCNESKEQEEEEEEEEVSAQSHPRLGGIYL